MEDIKEEYETTKTSFNKLSEKYNINAKKISRQAKKEGWKKFISEENSETLSETQMEKIDNLSSYLRNLTTDVNEEITVELYINSYKNFIAIQNAIKYDSFGENETKLLKQLQIEKNNLSKLGTDIKAMEGGFSATSKALSREERDDLYS